MSGDHNMNCSANQALDKMAENARALGLDYEPAQQQEPVGEVIGTNEYAGFGQIRHTKTIQWRGEPLPIGTKLYTSPPASKPLTDEQEYEAIGTAGNDLLALAKRWADNEVHVYQFDNEARKIIKAVLHRAHGIKGDT